MSKKLYPISSDLLGFPGGSEVKVSACDAGDLGSIPGLGRSPGEGSGNPLQYSCLENPMDAGTWWATVHGVAKSQTLLCDSTGLNLELNISYDTVKCKEKEKWKNALRMILRQKIICQNCSKQKQTLYL